MAKKDNPIMRAMRGGSKETMPPMPMMEPKQTLRMNSSDMPSMKNKKPNDPMKCMCEGVMQSMDNEGNMTMSINKISDAGSVESEVSEEEPEVMTPSVAPYPGGA